MMDKRIYPLIFLLVSLVACHSRAPEEPARPILPSLAPYATMTVPGASTPGADHAPARFESMPTRNPTRSADQVRQTPRTTPVVVAPPPRRALTHLPQAEVKGMYGFYQLMPLSCEARSASDWVRHFGISVREREFFSALPKSKNPEEGFVGDVNGAWGQIPPNAYGVHAAPVAKLLREYGAKAKAVRHMPFEEVQAEISAGRPVMVWVVGHVEPGKGVPYEIDGMTVTVARYEHTVIVFGYNDSTGKLKILDGKKIYNKTYEEFQKSWAVLENMAIVWEEESNSGQSPLADGQ